MTPSELELIAARDHEAMARFYDNHVAFVGEFCGAVCPHERVDEAVAAVFLNFLGRANEAPHDAEPEQLLRRAAREVAASRIETQGANPDEPPAPVCRAMPELLAARLNGELTGEDSRVVDHLSECPTCQATAARLGEAEVLTPAGSGGGVSELRAEWLQLAGAATKHAGAAKANEPAADPLAFETRPRPTGPSQPSANSPSERAVRVRARRGGLVGTVRRLARSRTNDQARDNADATEDGA